MSHDVALERAAADPTRVLSRDPAFLRRAHERVEDSAAERPTPTWTFDTRATPLETIVTVITGDILATAATPV